MWWLHFRDVIHTELIHEGDVGDVFANKDGRCRVRSLAVVWFHWHHVNAELGIDWILDEIGVFTADGHVAAFSISSLHGGGTKYEMGWQRSWNKVLKT